MKGIILAGGAGTRLYPLTTVVSKQLLPIYDKPLIYYALSVLMQSGIQEILIISTPEDLPNFRRLLGTGEHWGVNFDYVVQPTPNGLAQAFILGEKFIGDDSVCLILGDNIFHGDSLIDAYRLACSRVKDNIATVFGYYVTDPERYGVVEFDLYGKAISIEEKPLEPKSNYAVTGLYYYDNSVIEVAKSIKPSSRGELEITDINKYYLAFNLLHVERMGRGSVWLDTGTQDSFIEATNYVHAVEKRQGLKIGCPEEIAWNLGFITDGQLESAIKKLGKSPYGMYLKSLLAEKK